MLADLSDDVAARKLGIDLPLLNNIENGQVLIGSQELLKRFGKLYSVSSDSLAELSSLRAQSMDPKEIDPDGYIEEQRPRETAVDNLERAIKTPTGNFGIFISYRRSDQAAMAGRLYDKLVGKFGYGKVFMDVDSIDLGLDFVEVLEQTLARCKALIVVIGRDWLSAQDEDTNRRLDNPDDFVRLEIEMALMRDIRVIPILVDGTRMPRAIELPDSIKALSRRNGRDIWNARFNSDCLELISTLERILGAHDG
jgi:hypothetical protein